MIGRFLIEPGGGMRGMMTGRWKRIAEQHYFDFWRSVPCHVVPCDAMQAQLQPFFYLRILERSTDHFIASLTPQKSHVFPPLRTAYCVEPNTSTKHTQHPYRNRDRKIQGPPGKIHIPVLGVDYTAYSFSLSLSLSFVSQQLSSLRAHI